MKFSILLRLLALVIAFGMILAPLCAPICEARPCAGQTQRSAEAAAPECHGHMQMAGPEAEAILHSAASAPCLLSQFPTARLTSNEVVPSAPAAQILAAYFPAAQPPTNSFFFPNGRSANHPPGNSSALFLIPLRL